MKINRRFIELVIDVAENENWNIDASEVLDCFDELKHQGLKITRESIFAYFNGDL